MEALVSGTLLALLSGLTFAAYKHHKLYAKHSNYLIACSLGGLISLLTYNRGPFLGWGWLIPNPFSNAADGQTTEWQLVDKFIPVLYVYYLLGIIAYLFALKFLPKIVCINKTSAGTKKED